MLGWCFIGGILLRANLRGAFWKSWLVESFYLFGLLGAPSPQHYQYVLGGAGDLESGFKSGSEWVTCELWT